MYPIDFNSLSIHTTPFSWMIYAHAAYHPNYSPRIPLFSLNYQELCKRHGKHVI